MTTYKNINSDIKQAVDQIIDQIQAALEVTHKKDSAQDTFIQLQKNIEKLQENIGGSESQVELSEFSDLFNELCITLEIQESYSSLLEVVQCEMANAQRLNPGSSQDAFNYFIRTLLETLAEDKEAFWDAKRKEYKNSAKEAIAQSLSSLDIPSFSAGTLETD